MFNFNKKNSLTSQVAPRSTQPLVVASPTRGNCRLTSAAAAIMKIDYDAVASEDGVFVDLYRNEEDGNLYVYVVPSEWAQNDTVRGAKLAATGKGSGGNLLFSNLNAYAALGGKPSSETDMIYNVRHLVGATPVMWEDGDGVEVAFYPVTFLDEKVSDKRGEGADEDADEAFDGEE